MAIHKNTSLRDARALALRLGWSVTLGGHGDLIFSPGPNQPRFSCNAFRKDTPQGLVSLLRRAEKAQESAPPKPRK